MAGFCHRRARHTPKRPKRYETDTLRVGGHWLSNQPVCIGHEVFAEKICFFCRQVRPSKKSQTVCGISKLGEFTEWFKIVSPLFCSSSHPLIHQFLTAVLVKQRLRRCQKAQMSNATVSFFGSGSSRPATMAKRIHFSYVFQYKYVQITCCPDKNQGQSGKKNLKQHFLDWVSLRVRITPTLVSTKKMPSKACTSRPRPQT